MKAIMLAAVLGLLTAGAMTVLLRSARPLTRFRALMLVYAAGLAGLVLCHLATPADLWVFSPDLLAQSAALDLGFALFLYTAGFWGGLLQLYNLADRGLSLRILIDILEAPSGALSAQEITRAYSAGRGLDWMYEKRLSGLVAARLIERRDGRVAATGHGLRLAGLIAAARRLFPVERTARDEPTA